jgi:hypothetical protein
MGIVWISVPAHDQASRFNAVASMGTLGTVFHARRRLPETTTFRFHIRTMPTAPNAGRCRLDPVSISPAFAPVPGIRADSCGALSRIASVSCRAEEGRRPESPIRAQRLIPVRSWAGPSHLLGGTQNVRALHHQADCRSCPVERGNTGSVA